MSQKMKKISTSFQQWLLLIVGVAFIVTLVFLGEYQTKLFTDSADNLLKIYIKDVRNDITNMSNKNLLVLTKAVATELNNAELITSELLTSMLDKYNVTEINYIAPNGVIQASSNADFVGFNMTKGGRQSADFLSLLGAITEYVQPFQPIGYNAQISRKYAGVSLAKGGFVQVGYDEKNYYRAVGVAANEVVKNRHVGESGFLIVTDSEWRIVSDRSNNRNQPVTIVTAMTKDITTIDKDEIFEEGIYIDGTFQRCFCMHNAIEGYKVIAVYPYSEAMVSRNVSLKVITMMQIVIFGLLFVMIFLLVRRLIVMNLHKVNHALSAITAGKLETVVDVRSNEEFDALSNDINATVDTLKRYIKEAEERIDAELAFAKAIQHAALPSVFPPYPERKEF